jgi:hypothetical protein
MYSKSNGKGGIPGVCDLPTCWIYERRGVADVSIDEDFQFGQNTFHP